jgi:mannose-1-phosphate guanylyltransferase
VEEEVDIVSEPERRDTFPAIALTTAYLTYEKGISEDEVVTILPVDAYADDSYYKLLLEMAEAIEKDLADIALMGIKPTISTSKYGYVVPNFEIAPAVLSVNHFVEKPSEETASKLISEGALWNGGVFAVKICYVLDSLRKQIEFDNYYDIVTQYHKLKKISFDYEVVEKADRIAVLPYDGEWSDIGSWRTLTDKLYDKVSGNAVCDDCDNTYIINELKIPVCVIGINNAIISVTADGVLVSDLVASSRLKDVTEKVSIARNMYEKRRWGEYTVLDQDENSLVKRLFLNEGKSISYQWHKYRDEIWIMTAGMGEVTIDDKKH